MHIKKFWNISLNMVFIDIGYFIKSYYVVQGYKYIAKLYYHVIWAISQLMVQFYLNYIISYNFFLFLSVIFSSFYC